MLETAEINVYSQSLNFLKLAGNERKEIFATKKHVFLQAVLQTAELKLLQPKLFPAGFASSCENKVFTAKVCTCGSLLETNQNKF